MMSYASNLHTFVAKEVKHQKALNAAESGMVMAMVRVSNRDTIANQLAELAAFQAVARNFTTDTGIQVRFSDIPPAGGQDTRQLVANPPLLWQIRVRIRNWL